MPGAALTHIHKDDKTAAQALGKRLEIRPAVRRGRVDVQMHIPRQKLPLRRHRKAKRKPQIGAVAGGQTGRRQDRTVVDVERSQGRMVEIGEMQRPFGNRVLIAERIGKGGADGIGERVGE